MGIVPAKFIKHNENNLTGAKMKESDLTIRMVEAMLNYLLDSEQITNTEYSMAISHLHNT